LYLFSFLVSFRRRSSIITCPFSLFNNNNNYDNLLIFHFENRNLNWIILHHVTMSTIKIIHFISGFQNQRVLKVWKKQFQFAKSLYNYQIIGYFQLFHEIGRSPCSLTRCCRWGLVWSCKYNKFCQGLFLFNFSLFQFSGVSALAKASVLSSLSLLFFNSSPF